MTNDDMLALLALEAQAEAEARFEDTYELPFSDESVDAWIAALPTWGDIA